MHWVSAWVITLLRVIIPINKDQFAFMPCTLQRSICGVQKAFFDHISKVACEVLIFVPVPLQGRVLPLLILKIHPGQSQLEEFVHASYERGNSKEEREV